MSIGRKTISWFVGSLLLLGSSSKSLADFKDIDGKDGMFVMGAIGDSITTGFNANILLDNKSLSWSTGYAKSKKVNSHYWRVQKVYDGAVYQINAAKAGARSDALAGQLDKMKKELKGRELDYLTLMIGANDVCSWPVDHEDSLATFSSRVRSTLDGALATNPDMKISLVPVPDMVRLYDVGKAKGCSAAWKIFKICPNLLNQKDPLKRAAFGERVRDLNDNLAAIASEYPHAVHYAADVATFEFESEDISGVDCFHPSWRGQNKIAAMSWGGGWYDRMPQNEMLLSQTP